MDFIYAYHTDVGTTKNTNQDSLCVRVAQCGSGKILMALICDGMGGLEKGEVASAAIIRAFVRWFENDLAGLLSDTDCGEKIKNSWELLVKQQNEAIAEYGKSQHIQLGSTVTAMLILSSGRCIITHVGDTRVYRITDDAVQILTADQTLVAREIRLGRLTREQALVDPRRNVLLQCVGASVKVVPDFISTEVAENECYMLCSDGFRHKITPEEIQKAFCPGVLGSEEQMKSKIKELTELDKARGETDNISAILIKTV